VQPQCSHAQPQASLPTVPGCETHSWRTFWDLVSQTCTTASSVPVPKIWPSGCNATLLYAESIVGLVNCRNSKVSALPYCHSVLQGGLNICKTAGCPHCHICHEHLSGLHTDGAFMWTDSMRSAAPGRQHESPLCQQRSNNLTSVRNI